MIPTRALPDLLAAERGLARIDVLLRDEARARRHACDAARRSVLALATLDGTLVDPEDLLLALVSPEEVELPRRADAATTVGMYRLLLALRNGLTPFIDAPTEAPEDARLRPATMAAWSALTAETRRLLAEVEAVLHQDEDVPEPVADCRKPLPPWSVPWVEEIHARWHEARNGRRPPPWGGEQRSIAQEGLRIVDEALAVDPGLVGAVRALHRLHYAREFPTGSLPVRAGEDERSQAIRTYMANQPSAGWWPQFARIVAPQLIARACRLERVWIPLTAYWGRDYTGYRLGIGGSEEDWVAATARLIADAAEREAERSERIEARHAGWIEATAVVPRLPKARKDTLGPTRRQRAGTRRSTGRLPRLLDLLWEQPVVRARTVEARLAMTYRSALDLIEDLEKAGVLRLATDRKLDRLWRAAVV